MQNKPTFVELNNILDAMSAEEFEALNATQEARTEFLRKYGWTEEDIEQEVLRIFRPE